MDKKEALQILDEIDTLRRKHEHTAEQKNGDWLLRVACAIIAKKAGFADRMEWCEELKKDKTTEYAKYYYFYPNVNTKEGKAYDNYYIPNADNK